MPSNYLIPFLIPFLHWDVVLFTHFVCLLASGAGEWNVPQKAVNYMKKPNVGQLDKLSGAAAFLYPDSYIR
jgi:hypothetical protein